MFNQRLNRRALVRLGAKGVGGAMLASAAVRQRSFATLAKGLAQNLPGDGVMTIVVAGLDTRSPDQPENTDVLKVARIDLNAPTVRVITIPRDLYVEIPTIGYDKINRAYDYGSKPNVRDWNAGAALVRQTIELNFGVETHGMITTNFAGYTKIVDTFGGVDVQNPYDIYDSQYPTEDYGTKEIYFKAGPLHLSGAEALEFSRTRHQDGDDGRVMRQQLVLQGLLEKAQEGSFVTKLPGLVNAGRKLVQTDFSQAQEAALVAAVPDIPTDNVVFATMTQYLWGATLDNGMWVYQGNWNTLPGFVQSFLNG